MYAIIDPLSGLPRGLTVLEKADVRAGIAAASDAAVDDVTLALSGHTSRQDNPHNVNATDVGLANVDNTADIDKPVSALQAQAISGAVTAPRIATATAPMTFAQRCALMGISTATTAPDPALYRWYANSAGIIYYSNGTAWSAI